VLNNNNNNNKRNVLHHLIFPSVYCDLDGQALSIKHIRGSPRSLAPWCKIFPLCVSNDLRQFNGVKCCRYVHDDSLGVKFSLYAQRHDWHKIFPLGIKAIFAILRQSMYDQNSANIAMVT